jgi:hypothetical protein
MGLIFIYGLHVDLVVLRMRADEFDPGDTGPILHFHDQTVLVLVATDLRNSARARASTAYGTDRDGWFQAIGCHWVQKWP